MPGSEKDRKMAALALYLHSDILDDHPELKSENLTIEHEFGLPLAVGMLPDETLQVTGEHDRIRIEIRHSNNVYETLENAVLEIESNNPDADGKENVHDR